MFVGPSISTVFDGFIGRLVHMIRSVDVASIFCAAHFTVCRGVCTFLWVWLYLITFSYSTSCVDSVHTIYPQIKQFNVLVLIFHFQQVQNWKPELMELEAQAKQVRFPGISGYSHLDHISLTCLSHINLVTCLNRQHTLLEIEILLSSIQSCQRFVVHVQWLF